MIAPLPRKHLYQLAHRILPRTLLDQPEASWGALLGDESEAWLAEQWQAASGMVDAADRMEQPTLRIEERELPGDWRGLILHTPSQKGRPSPTPPSSFDEAAKPATSSSSALRPMPSPARSQSGPSLEPRETASAWGRSRPVMSTTRSKRSDLS